MSFILDALRKSDQQRQRGRAPTLAAAPRPATQSPAGTPRAWLVAHILAVIVFGIGLLVGGLRPWQEQHSASPPAPVIAAPPPTTGTLSPRPGEPVAVAPPSTAPERADAAVKANPPARIAATRPAAEPVPRAALPPLSITAHAWAPDAAERMVRINGKMQKEGEEIEPGLRLEKITAEGVVLNHRGRRLKRDLH